MQVHDTSLAGCSGLWRTCRGATARKSRGVGVRFNHIWLILLLAAATDSTAQLSVPPAYFPGHGTKIAHPLAQMRSAGDAPSRAIFLPRPTAAEYATLRPASVGSDPNSKPRKSRGAAVGFPRVIPAPDNAIPLADLPWQTLPDGTRTARIELTSRGAVAIRVQIGLDNPLDGLVLRFKGSASAALIFANTAAAIVGNHAFWTPVLEGESATIELEVAPGVAAGDAILAVPMISHLGAADSGFKSLSSYIGRAEACEVDVACVTPALQQQIASASNAVARLIVTVSGTTYLCSGTLLNDARGSFTPYFLTANHCVTGLVDTTGPGGVAADAATTVNTYWFFQASACGVQAEPAYTLVADGAALLARSVDYDWSLLRLNGAPPAG